MKLGIAARRGLDLARQGDLILAALVVGIVAMMIIPLPTFLLDILITTNISIAVLLLLVSIYVTDALRIAAFPSMLLITTLFRLGLNVSSTRLILLQADAGQVIRSFGEFVVAGNLVVGAVIFLILTLIQFIVIAKGSERVAEVAARFTLDAMPGKQMAIDADVRAGAIDMEQARRMRRQLQRESQLYGSMDGAMKFVKGDAIAGILITVINIAGGLVIGVLQRGMTLADAARVYSLLTIGDGLVSQIPALLISTAAGIVVTRVASEDEGTHLGHEIGSQVLAQPRAVAIAAGLLVLLAVVPGLPTVPFLVLASVVGTVALRLHRKSSGQQDVESGRRLPEAERVAEEGAGPTGPSAVALEVGPALIPLVSLGSEGSRMLNELVPGLREMMHAELGLLVPRINVRGNEQLDDRAYRILLSDVPLADGQADPDQQIALAQPAQLPEIGLEGAEVLRLPGLALPGVRVPAVMAARLAARGIQLVDPPTQMVLHLGQVLREQAAELMGIQEAQQLLDVLDRTHPALVQEVVPKLVSMQTFTDVLRRLLEEQVSIRDLRRILETLGEWGASERDTVVLTEHVRVGLRRQICHRHAGADGRLRALLLDPVIEDTVRDAIQHTPKGSYLALEPQIRRDIVEAVRAELRRLPAGAAFPPLLTVMDVRRYVRRLIDIELPELPVLSFEELTPTTSVEAVARVAVVSGGA